MSRNLIDRDVLLEKAKQEQRFYKDEYDAMESGYLDEEREIVKEAYTTMTDCVSLINNAPTIDAVEVVRCTECRWADRYTTKRGKFCHCLETEKRGLTETDYCSFGEKMDGEVKNDG